MAVWIKIVWKIIGWILTVIGLGGVSDDIEKWIEWLSSINPTLNQVAINMFDALHGDLGRWVFTLSGAVAPFAWTEFPIS